MRPMRGTKGRYGCRASDMVFRHRASGDVMLVFGASSGTASDTEFCSAHKY